MIYLKECRDKESRSLFKDTIDNHHSYVKHKRTPTRTIDWLVYEKETNNLIGAVGINSATMNLAARDKIINLDNKDKLKLLRNFANNYRFCLIKDNITIENAGSQVLKAVREEGAKRWKEKYDDELLGIETFVKPPWNGAVYKADNWVGLGMTSGVSMKRLPLKLIPKKYHKKMLADFKKDNLTNRKVAVFQTDKKLIFFKSLVKDLKVEIDNIVNATRYKKVLRDS